MTRMAVHNGVFHADDVFAVALMTSLIEGLEVIRTRNKELLTICDIVADVGEGKYDHHQKEKKLREDGIPYCAFGLLWQDFGIPYIQKHFKELTEEQEKEVADKIAYDFITQIDAHDNGVDMNQYEIPVTTINQVISQFMPFERTEEAVDESFKEAVKFADTFLYKMVRKSTESYYNRNYVEEQLNKQPIASNRYLVLDKTVGWKDAIMKLDPEEQVLFVIFQDITGSWRVQTVPKEENSFEARKDLPRAWAGLREEELSNLTGIEGCIFCHPSLFIAGNQTKEGAIQMAIQAIESAEFKEVIESIEIH